MRRLTRFLPLLVLGTGCELAPDEPHPLLPGGRAGQHPAAAFQHSVLVVESEHDDIVPRPAVANYLAAFGGAHSLTYRVIDGADHARRFLRERGFSAAAAGTVWTAIALHTTPGIPGR